jgi:hypothetical protein
MTAMIATIYDNFKTIIRMYHSPLIYVIYKIFNNIIVNCELFVLIRLKNVFIMRWILLF